MNPLESFSVDTIQGDPERTICLVLTAPEAARVSDIVQARDYVGLALFGTKWEGVPVLIGCAGWKIEAIELPKAEAEKLESWRDKEAML